MRLVVSLTTIPSRYEILRKALASLCQQTEPPDAIYLNLPHKSVRQGVEYPEFDASEFPQVTVVRCESDWGPGTKLVPTLLRERDPQTVIVTVDDDVSYPNIFVSRMKAALFRIPNGAVGFCGWNVATLLAGGTYDFVYEEHTPHEDGIGVDVLEGYRGVAYRRGDFGDDLLDLAGSLPNEAYLVDDVWISGYLHGKGAPRRVARFIPEMTLTPEQVWGSLWIQHGLSAEAQGLRGLGDTEARNRRVAAQFFAPNAEKAERNKWWTLEKSDVSNGNIDVRMRKR